jgi:hypothetical protein
MPGAIIRVIAHYRTRMKQEFSLCGTGFSYWNRQSRANV